MCLLSNDLYSATWSHCFHLIEGLLHLSFGAVDEESLLNRLLLLATLVNSLAGTLCVATEHKLGLEFPLLRNVPVTLCLLVNLKRR